MSERSLLERAIGAPAAGYVNPLLDAITQYLEDPRRDDFKRLRRSSFSPFELEDIQEERGVIEPSEPEQDPIRTIEELAGSFSEPSAPESVNPEKTIEEMIKKVSGPVKEGNTLSEGVYKVGRDEEYTGKGSYSKASRGTADRKMLNLLGPGRYGERKMKEAELLSLAQSLQGGGPSEEGAMGAIYKQNPTMWLVLNALGEDVSTKEKLEFVRELGLLGK